MRPRTRGISTVVDVAMALFLITASIGIVMAFLDTGSANTPETAERTANTLAGTTMNTSYSLIPIRDEEEFDDKGYSDDAYERQSYGSVAGEIAAATVVNARFNDTAGDDAGDTELLTKEGVRYSRAVEGQTLEMLSATNSDARVTAIWRPYEDAEIEGRQQYGPTPPGDADVSTETITVPSSIPKSDESKIESAYSPSQNRLAGGRRTRRQSDNRGVFPT
ncbi:hypothetical protein ACFQER_15465 [Halomicroarcula sp. GCM10025894]|uniref:DUF7284 family protein n=1 Tax=Halomicroarcula sp. GCM10025894 TaxID=3252673 RepID=UPI00361A6F7E